MTYIVGTLFVDSQHTSTNEASRILWEGDSIKSTTLKDIWLQECLKGFPTEDINKGKYGASAIVYTGSSSIFIDLSYDYVISDQNCHSQS